MTQTPTLPFLSVKWSGIWLICNLNIGRSHTGQKTDKLDKIVKSLSILSPNDSFHSIFTKCSINTSSLMFHTRHCKRQDSHWKLCDFITYRKCKSGKSWRGTDSLKKYRIGLGRNISQKRSIIKHPNCQLPVKSQWEKHVWKNAEMCGELRGSIATQLYTWRVTRHLFRLLNPT